MSYDVSCFLLAFPHAGGREGDGLPASWRTVQSGGDMSVAALLRVGSFGILENNLSSEIGTSFLALNSLVDFDRWSNRTMIV